MIPDWLLYILAAFGALSLLIQLGYGAVLLVRRVRVAAAWRNQGRGVWP